MRNRKPASYIIPAAGIVFFLFFPGPAAAGVREGLLLCARLLIPALFPISVLSGCLLMMRNTSSACVLSDRIIMAVFGVSGRCKAPFLLGLVGGFPLGAHLAASLYRNGQISKEEAEYSAFFCNQAGPGFLLGTAGLCLGSISLGAVLMIIQTLSAFSAGFLLRKPRISNAPPVPQINEVSFFSALPGAISNSASAMLRLAGAVALFQAFVHCLGAVFPLYKLPGFWQAGINGFLELSGGIAALRGLEWKGAFLLASVLVNWGGLCVHLQAAEALGSLGLSVRNYLFGKLVQACFGFLYAALFLLTLS